MGKIIRILIAAFGVLVLGCTVYDKDNKYLVKPAKVYSIPANATCSGSYFALAFPSDSKLIKLTDSTFAIARGKIILIYDDLGNQTDSLSIQITSINSSTPVVRFSDGTGFFMLNGGSLFAFNNQFKELWHVYIGVLPQTPGLNLIAGPNNSLIYETGNGIYVVNSLGDNSWYMNMSTRVDDILSIVALPDGSVVAYALIKNNPDGYNDFYGMFKVFPNGAVNQYFSWSYGSKYKYRGTLNPVDEWHFSFMTYEEKADNYYYYQTNFIYLDSALNQYSQYPDFFSTKFRDLPSSDVSTISLGNGYSLLGVDFYYSSSYLFDVNGEKTIINGFVPANGPYRIRLSQPTFSIMRDKKLLVSTLQDKVSNYYNDDSYSLNQYLLVFSADFSGNYCK